MTAPAHVLRSCLLIAGGGARCSVGHIPAVCAGCALFLSWFMRPSAHLTERAAVPGTGLACKVCNLLTEPASWCGRRRGQPQARAHVRPTTSCLHCRLFWSVCQVVGSQLPAGRFPCECPKPMAPEHPQLSALRSKVLWKQSCSCVLHGGGVQPTNVSEILTRPCIKRSTTRAGARRTTRCKRRA